MYFLNLDIADLLHTMVTKRFLFSLFSLKVPCIQSIPASIFTGLSVKVFAFLCFLQPSICTVVWVVIRPGFLIVQDLTLLCQDEPSLFLSYQNPWEFGVSPGMLSIQCRPASSLQECCCQAQMFLHSISNGVHFFNELFGVCLFAIINLACNLQCTEDFV